MENAVGKLRVTIMLTRLRYEMWNLIMIILRATMPSLFHATLSRVRH